MADPHLERMRAIVQSLPGTGEKTPWGPDPHFTVADKIFTGWSRDDDGGSSVGVKCTLELQAMLVSSDPRFSVAPYVGKHGWVTFRIGTDPDWNEVEALVLGSYLLIAPKKLAAQVGSGARATAAVATAASAGKKPGMKARMKARAKPAAKRSAAMKRAPMKKPAPTKKAAKKPAPAKKAAKKPAAKLAKRRPTAEKRVAGTRARVAD